MKKKWLLAPVAIGGAIVAVFGLAGNYFFNIALNATRKRNQTSSGSDAEEDKSEFAEQKRADRLANEEFERTTEKTAANIKSGDGLNLRAYKYLTGERGSNHKWAIVVHGYTSKSSEMLTFIRNFCEHGFNVLAVDLRGHGESDGHYIGMG